MNIDSTGFKWISQIKHMKNIILGLIAFTLFLTGCSVISSKNSDISPASVSYRMEIIKSEVNKNMLEFVAKENSTGQELLDQSGVEYQKNGEIVTKLDGVISTLSKSWNLYVDGFQIDLNAPIKSESRIEWKYEAK